MYICLHNAENRGKSEEPLDKSASAFTQRPSVPLQFVDMDYTKPCCKNWSFYRTSYHDRFHFPFSFLSLSLSQSPSCFLFVILSCAVLWYDMHLLPHLLLTSLQSPLTLHLATTLSSLSSLPLQRMGEHSALWLFLIPDSLFYVFFTWPKLLSSKWLTEFPLQHHWQPFE